MSLGEKVVLITGSSNGRLEFNTRKIYDINCLYLLLFTGIGSATARHLAAVGYKKLALVSRNVDELNKVAAKCRENGADNVLVLQIDLATVEASAEAVKKTTDHFQRNDRIKVLCWSEAQRQVANVILRRLGYFDMQCEHEPDQLPRERQRRQSELVSTHDERQLHVSGGDDEGGAPVLGSHQGKRPLHVVGGRSVG